MPAPTPVVAKKNNALQPMKNKPVVTILLLGETGCGKTSFMSLLLNLFQGNGPFELERQFNPSTVSGKSGAHSQTDTADIYTVTDSNGVTLRILDTPGLSDTRGEDEDKKHVVAIQKAIGEDVPTLDAVIVLANGSSERLLPSTKKALDDIMAMFPESINKNLGYIFTSADPGALNFHLDTLPAGVPYWAIQNPVAYYKNLKEKEKAGADEDQLDDIRNSTEIHYKITVKTLNKWLKWLDERVQMPNTAIKELYQQSVFIESKIQELLSGLTAASTQRESLNTLQTQLASADITAKEAMDAWNAHKAEQVWCLMPSDTVNKICNECHSNCVMDVDSDLATIAMRIGSYIHPVIGLVREFKPCDVCGHKPGQHRDAPSVHAQKPSALADSTTSSLHAAESGKEKIQIARDGAQKAWDDCEKQILGYQTDIRALIDKYNGRSLNKNFSGHIGSTLEQLKARREDLKSQPGNNAEVLGMVNEFINSLEAQKKNLDDKGKAQ